ncbi:AMIN domain-containing protein [Nostocaceae cyanobacterium CENA357]|uniref:AMIN domain-containing protein n=1 Tax=Atlanticothrix silvestris CENA357 TaxID=1725252 RepID=A0A8J7HIK4_9CYAN|nr:AMIN domain-containing protein [Atlanticothrix silvestris]MBH8555779.1 AMIN domain-containing protein [Atlanticothrix silvestris CENA357]
MYKRLTTRQFLQLSKQILGLSLYAAVGLETGSSIAAPVAKLNDWRFDPKTLQLEITLSAGTTPQYFYLSQPPRLVVDLPDTKLGYVSTNQNYAGAIQRIRVSQLDATVTRIVLDLATGTFIDPNQVQLQPVSKQNPTRWVLRPMISGYNRPSIQPGNVQSLPNNLTPSPNYPQLPSNLPSTNYQQLPSTLPPITTNQQQPLFTVPPIVPSNSSQVPSSILPPANFPNQTDNFNGTPPATSPAFPVPTIPNYPSNAPSIEVIEFGQPLPKRRN